MKKQIIVFLWSMLAAGILMVGLCVNGICAEGIVVKNISAQIAEKGADTYSITVSAFVTNQTSPLDDVIVDIIAVDKQGYQLESISLRGKVKPGKTRVLMDMMKISTAVYGQIDRWEVKH